MAAEEATVLQKEVVVFSAAGEVQSVLLTARGVDSQPGFRTGMPLAFCVTDSDVAVMDSTSDMTGGRIEVLEERVKAFE